jgi:simple sugar transport system permease protein
MQEKTNEQAIKKEPLFHIIKRTSVTWKFALAVRAACILLAFLFMAVLITILAKQNPLVLFRSMFDGLFGNSLRIWILFSDTAILLGISLALTPAFKMKFWNCGGEGQVLVGSLVSAMLMLFVGDSVPFPILIILMLALSILAGSIWGLVPSLFKAKWNTNETLFTLMMNYIALQIVMFFLKKFGNSQGNLDPMSEFALPKIFGGQYFFNIILILVICVAMHIYLKYSKQGYEISVVGESERTAKYVGINVRRVIIRTMIISGGICGLIGFLLVANGSCSVTATITGGRGFTAILVSWLAKFNPIYMILTSFLVVALQKSTSFMGDIYRLDTSMADIFIGVVLLFIIGCEFFINYKIVFRKNLFGFFNKDKEVDAK